MFSGNCSAHNSGIFHVFGSQSGYSPQLRPVVPIKKVVVHKPVALASKLMSTFGNLFSTNIFLTFQDYLNDFSKPQTTDANKLTGNVI